MIAIPNMSKPKSCDDCSCLEIDGTFEEDRWVSKPYCWLLGEHIRDDKRNDCPLIEIVQCKDCKRYETQADGLGRCTGWDRLCNDDHFCSFGERRNR